MNPIFRKNRIIPFLVLTALAVAVFSAWSLWKGMGKGYKSIVINEICASNLASLHDENGSHPDWVELYNKGDKDIDISGWKLSDSENKRGKWSFPEGTVIEGKNYLMVYLDSADRGLHTSFRLSGGQDSLYLSTKELLPVDSEEIPELKYDTVWAREKDGSKKFLRMTPTPMASNEEGSEVILPSLKEPVFSRESGFYDEAFELSLSSEEGEIHYTLDGSEPDRNSPLYTGPVTIRDRSQEDNVYSADPNVSVDLFDYVHMKFELPSSPVDKCTVVRAMVCDEAGNISESSTRSYFVGFNEKHEYDGIGVISLVSDPEGLFGYENGIYVIGENGTEDFKNRVSESENAVKFLKENPDTPLDGTVSIDRIKMDESINSNYMQSGSFWEREAVMTVFNKDHEAESSQNIGIRVKGHRTRNFPKKTMNIYARSCYGSGTFQQPFISGDDRRLSLSACGQDWLTLIRDILVTDLTKDLNFASLDYTEPYCVFLDGEFWGLYRISDKLDRDFVNLHFGVDKDQAIVIKNSILSDGKEEDFELYWSFKEFTEEADLSNDAEYGEFEAMADIDSIIDYFAARMYIDEGIDWPNINTALWRTRNTGDHREFADGRWRFLNFDNNLNIHYDSVSDDSMDMVVNGNKNHKRNEMFYRLMQNEGFKKRFEKRFKEIASVTFEPDRVIGLIDKYAEEIRPYVEKDYERFYGDNYTLADFDRDVEEMRQFFRERADYMVPYVEEACRTR